MPALLLALALLLAPALAAGAGADEIQPDRPEVTESARLVPAGTVQLETGLVFSGESRAGRSTERTFGTEADVRIGLARNLELNLELEPFVRVRGPEDDTGFGDLALGIRYRFVEGVEDAPWSPSLAIKPFVKLPTAGEPIGTGRADFGLLVMASVELPLDFELEVNAGGIAVGQSNSSDYRAQAVASAAVAHDLVGGMFAFLELFFNSPGQRGDRNHLAINTGLVYRLTPMLALDAGIQTSIYGQGPDYVFRTGLSARFGR
jgi:hypothetical protein